MNVLNLFAVFKNKEATTLFQRDFFIFLFAPIFKSSPAVLSFSERIKCLCDPNHSVYVVESKTDTYFIIVLKSWIWLRNRIAKKEIQMLANEEEITTTDPKRENIDINKLNEWKTKSNGFLWSPVDKRKILIYVLSLNIDRNTRARSNSPLSRVYIVERLDIADSTKYIQNNNNKNENAIFHLFHAINISDRYFYTILYFTWLFWHYIYVCVYNWYTLYLLFFICSPVSILSMLFLSLVVH